MSTTHEPSVAALSAQSRARAVLARTQALELLSRPPRSALSRGVVLLAFLSVAGITTAFLELPGELRVLLVLGGWGGLIAVTELVTLHRRLNAVIVLLMQLDSPATAAAEDALEVRHLNTFSEDDPRRSTRSRPEE